MSRKRTKRKVWPLLNPLLHAMQGAAISDTAILDRLRLIELMALDAFARGTATKDDWKTLADCLNVSETMARDGIGPEALEACTRAQDALGCARDRLEVHGRLAVSGPELEALREAYEFADLQRSSISRKRFEEAIRKTANRIRSAHPGVKVYV